MTLTNRVRPMPTGDPAAAAVVRAAGGGDDAGCLPSILVNVTNCPIVNFGGACGRPTHGRRRVASAKPTTAFLSDRSFLVH